MLADEVEDSGEGGGSFEAFEVDVDGEGFSDEAEEGDVCDGVPGGEGGVGGVGDFGGGEVGEDLGEAVDEEGGLGVGHGGVGGRSRARTADLLLVRQAL